MLHWVERFSINLLVHNSIMAVVMIVLVIIVTDLVLGLSFLERMGVHISMHTCREIVFQVILMWDQL